MRNQVERNGGRAVACVSAVAASLILLSSCGPPAPPRGPYQADVWYCFAMDRSGQKWAYRAPNIEEASRPAMAACRRESADPSSCQLPEEANCSNTGASGVGD